MEEEDDDFYDPADAVPVSNTQNAPHNQSSNTTPQHSNDDEEIEVEEDDDDEFNIITEAPPDAPAPEVPHPRHSMLRTESQRTPSTDLFPGSKSATPTLTPKAEPTTPVSGIARPTAPQKPGSEYPPVHASTIDVHANPTHPTTGKPILSTDMDFDFEDDKPWRRPGTDISDYFNYGFDEFTWASYVLKQRELRREVGDQKKQLDEMQAFLNGGMPPPMPGGPQPGPAPGPAAGPPPMPGMPGMPDMSPEIMQGILSTMMSRGLDPSTMDPMTFMQHAQAFMSGQSGAGGGQPAQAGFAGQGGQPQMGYGGGFNAGRGRGRRW